MNNDWPFLMVHLKVAANSEGETLQRSLTAAAVGEDPSVRRCRAATRQAIGQALARALALSHVPDFLLCQVCRSHGRCSGEAAAAEAVR